jgi:hypothetical protein
MTAKVEELTLGYALSGSGNDAICFYLSEALDVPIEIFEKLVEDGDIIGIDLCMWAAAGVRDPSVFGDDVVAARVREMVRELTGWVG